MTKRDPKQAEVIDADPSEGLLVVAGPGTGKTHVAAMRLVHLLSRGLRPGQILVLSFSRSAVATLTKRVRAQTTGDENVIEDLRHLTIRTFDSWAFRTLRQYGVPAVELLSQSHDDNIRRVTEIIRDRADFIADRLASIRHVIVDEFQDLPGVRAEMVTELLLHLTKSTSPRTGFTVLGDPAQAIFRFATRIAGQEVADTWEGLKTRLGSRLREVVLSKNYRSTDELAGLALNMRKILQSPLVTPEKKLEAVQRLLDRLPKSDPIAKLAPSWLDQVLEGSVAILTRTNGEAVRVAKMLLGDSVKPSEVSVRLRLAGSKPSSPAWIAILLSQFKPKHIDRSTFGKIYPKAIEGLDVTCRSSLQIPTLEVAWRRLAHASGVSDNATSIDIDVLRERLTWPDSFPDDQIHEEAAVYVTTIHQAKGMEFDNVALLETQARENSEQTVDAIEEANVGFVAITRASRSLHRLPSDCIYAAPGTWTHKGRSRLLSYGKMYNFQIGLPGDIESSSFVRSDLHGDASRVKALQIELAQRNAHLRGHKVLLKKSDSHLDSGRARDTRYDIYLQEGKEAGLLIGRTSRQLTYDLLGLLWNMGKHLPFSIYNLRIEDVVTISSADSENPNLIPEPWRTSRLWLGITLSGTGDFKTVKRNGD